MTQPPPGWSGPFSGFRQHLDELKTRMKVIIAALLVSLIFWLVVPADALDPTTFLNGMYRPVIALVLNHALSLAGGSVTIISGTLTAPLEIFFLASAVMAVVTSSPVIGYEIYRFVDPALREGERKTLTKFLAAFVGLFVGGAIVGYFVLTPAIIGFMVYFAEMVGATPVITASSYYGLVFMVVGSTAVSFTAPAVFVLLINFGILSTRALTNNRLIIYLGLYLVIATVTPEPVVGHLGMFFPMVIMLEISVLIGRRIERKRMNNAVGRETWRKGVTCEYCGVLLESASSFCPSCGRAWK